MSTTDDFVWRRAAVRVTLIIAAITAVLILLNLVWPDDTRTPAAVLGAFAALNYSFGPSVRNSDRVIAFSTGFATALAVVAIVDQVRSLDAQPGWAYLVSTAAATWLGAMAALFVTGLRVARRSPSPTREQ